MDPLKEGQVAEMTGLSCATLRSWRHRGVGPRWFKVGAKAVRYRRTDVEEWLEGQYVKAVS